MKAHGGVIFLEIIAVEVIMDFCINLMQCKLLGDLFIKLPGTKKNILTICASQLLFLFSFLLRSQTVL